MKNWKETYEKLSQKKQRFSIHNGDKNYHVEIEVKPYPVKTKSGQEGGFLTVANVYDDSGWGVRGETVCIPTDNFDFVFGARLALDRALNCVYRTHDCDGFTIKLVVNDSAKHAIWTEFVRLFLK